MFDCRPTISDGQFYPIPMLPKVRCFGNLSR